MTGMLKPQSEWSLDSGDVEDESGGYFQMRNAEMRDGINGAQFC